MLTTAVERKDDGTILLTLTIPWDRVSKTYHHVVDELVATSEIDGFRKGKAPKEMVEQKLDKSKVYEDVLRHLLPEIYNEAVKEQGLKPFVQPKIELKEATENKDWVIIVHTAEKPTVTLSDYKKAIAEKSSEKQNKIWVPGKDADQKPKPEDQKLTIDETVEILLANVTTSLPSLLIEAEVNRMLSDLVNRTKQLGLSVEQYLSSTGQTAESIRAQYTRDSTRLLTLELALEEVADAQGILVSDDDIETVLKTAKTGEERESLEGQKYYLASVLRRQKTLDFLSSL